MAPRMPITCSNDIPQQHTPEVWRFNNGNFVDVRNEEMSLTELLATSQIHVAVRRYGWAAIVEQLRGPGAQLAFRDADNNTVLHHAFTYTLADEYVDTMVSSYLRESNENLMNSDGLSYFHIVCARSKLEHVQEFFNGTDVDINKQVHKNSYSGYDGFTALHFAVDYGKMYVAAFLLNNNANLYVQNKFGMTPLHMACYDGQAKMIELLLAYDQTYVNLIDENNLSHFMIACTASNSHLAEQYLIAATQRDGVSPITLVSEKCTIPCMFGNYTPLHFAAESGRYETAKLLLDYGASCCALTTDNLTPSMLAHRLDNVELSNFLKQHEDYQAQILNLGKTQFQLMPDYFCTLEEDASSDNEKGSQDYSSPAATYGTDFQRYGQNATVVVNVTSSNKMQTHSLSGCEDYGIYLYED